MCLRHLALWRPNFAMGPVTLTDTADRFAPLRPYSAYRLGKPVNLLETQSQHVWITVFCLQIVSGIPWSHAWSSDQLRAISTRARSHSYNTRIDSWYMLIFKWWSGQAQSYSWPIRHMRHSESCVDMCKYSMNFHDLLVRARAASRGCRWAGPMPLDQRRCLIRLALRKSRINRSAATAGRVQSEVQPLVTSALACFNGMSSN